MQGSYDIQIRCIVDCGDSHRFPLMIQVGDEQVWSTVYDPVSASDPAPSSD